MNTRVLKVNPRSISSDAIAQAVRVLEAGGLVVFPTETVYGIAVNLLDKKAVDRLKELKERSETKQFSVHIASKADVARYAIGVLPRAYKVMERFWPGPLTLVFEAPEGKSVGLRLPQNEVALALLRCVDFPVIAPSANAAGHPAPCTADEALRDVEGKVELVLDAGPTTVGRESTVLDARRLPFAVLREGAIPRGDILEVARKTTALFVCTGNSCRSVMAEYLLKKKAQEMGRDDIVSISAGTFAMFGMGPTRETVRLVQGLGLDAAGHRAQRLTQDLIRSSDLVFAMESRHRDEVLRLAPEARERVHLIGEFLPAPSADDKDVSDPIGKSEEFYRTIYLKIQAAIDQIGKTL